MNAATSLSASAPPAADAPKEVPLGDAPKEVPRPVPQGLPSVEGSPLGGLGDWRIGRARAAERFAPVVRGWTIEIVDETGSTNADLMARLRNLPRDAAEQHPPVVRIAYLQTAGRGRRGRPWYAQPGNALLFSLGCVLPRPLEGLAGLSLAIGTALVEGLRTLPLANPKCVALKWPNDVLLDVPQCPRETSFDRRKPLAPKEVPRPAGSPPPRRKSPAPQEVPRPAGSPLGGLGDWGIGGLGDCGVGQGGGKLAGILVETAWSTPLASAVVIGVGINVTGAEAVAAQVDALDAGGNQEARSTRPAALSQALAGANLTDTLAAVLNALAGALERFSSDGFAPFRDRWSAYHAYAGREVVLLEQGTEVARGIALDVDASGQLLLDTPQGVRPVATGDVSLRLAESAGIEGNAA
jgi:BirA family biotin operon repressor/biotin-[acetyl-CoA-carboxylase] ligase